MLLEATGLTVAYGDMVALRDVSLQVAEGEAVAVLGANAAGKSTLLKALVGLAPLRQGRISFAGTRIERHAVHERVTRGLVYVPEGRWVFPFLSVEENLRLGAFNARARPTAAQTLAQVYTLFPKLAERRRQLAGSLSGGEQQMLAIGRGLMAQPKLLLLDEPSLGLAPLLVRELMRQIARIHASGVTVLIVEQNAHRTLELVDRGYVLEHGTLTLEGRAEALRNSDEVRRAYLGV
jgi:branched-chain amino acid transport system ATP-binding protein